MNYTIIFDDYTGLQHSKSSNSIDLHQDLINLFNDEYNVIEVYGDDDGVYDTSVLLRRIYDACYDSLVPNSIPAAVLVLAKYQYQMAFVADQEINLLACLTEIMVECEFQ